MTTRTLTSITQAGHVGATRDGQWGPETTKALQRAVNAGMF